MTEDEWHACTDPVPMLKRVGRARKRHARKLRWFACACVERIRGYLSDDAEFRAVEVAGQFADGLATVEELAAAREAAEGCGIEGSANTACLSVCLDDPRATAFRVSQATAWAEFSATELTIEASGPADYIGTPEQAEVKERAAQAQLLRCIFPYHKPKIEPAWLTSTVVSMAQGIYQDRAFDRLPILADALMDAGCDHTELLAHCRSDGPHTRGCFVVDACLGRE